MEQTAVLEVTQGVPCEGTLQRVVVAVVAAKDRTEDGLTLLRGEASEGVQIVDGYTQVGTAAHVAGEHKSYVVLIEISHKSLVVAHARVGSGSMIELHVLWCDDIGCIGIGKDEVHFSLSIEVDTRLDGRDQVGVGDIGDGIVVEHIAHRQVHVRGIYGG